MSLKPSFVKEKVNIAEKSINMLYSESPMPAIWANALFLILWNIVYNFNEKITTIRPKRPLDTGSGKSRVRDPRAHGNPG
jgi:hypothetical protein